MLEISKKLFDDYNNKGVLYCHWKSNEHLMEGLDGETDLDILVSKDSKTLSDKCLSENGFVKAITQFGSIYPNVEEWIGYDEGAGKLIHIHLHYELVTGQKHQKEYVLPWGELMLSRRIFDEKTGVYTADPVLELVVLKVRIILKMSIKRRILLFFGKKVPYGNSLKRELDYLFAQVSIEDVKELIKSLFDEGCNQLLAYFVGKERYYSDAVKYRRVLMRMLKGGRRYGLFCTLLRTAYFRICFGLRRIGKKLTIAQPIYRKRLREKGSLIAFVGADGCGKSTVTTDTEKWLTWKLEASRFYLGSGDHYNPLSKRIMAVIQKKKNEMLHRKSSSISNDIVFVGGKKESTEELKKNTKKVGFVRHVAHVYDAVYQLSIARHCKKTLFKADRYRQKGGIALLDRYPQMQFEGINDGPKIAARYARVHDTVFFRYMTKREYKYFDKICTVKPDVVIKLYVSPEESIRRKPDHKYEEVAKKASVVENLIFQGANVCTISTEQDFETEIKLIRSIIWGEISK